MFASNPVQKYNTYIPKRYQTIQYVMGPITNAFRIHTITIKPLNGLLLLPKNTKQEGVLQI
jgi:hypothetical protein